MARRLPRTAGAVLRGGRAFHGLRRRGADFGRGYIPWPLGAGEGATVAVVDLDRGQEASKQPPRAFEVCFGL